MSHVIALCPSQFGNLKYPLPLFAKTSVSSHRGLGGHDSKELLVCVPHAQAQCSTGHFAFWSVRATAGLVGAEGPSDISGFKGITLKEHA